MRKKLGVILYVIALMSLFIILQYDFKEDDATKMQSLPLSGKVIVLDPGHGGPDPGAVKGEGIEKDIALNVSLMLRDYLQQQGALVLMTREIDTDLAGEDVKGYSRRKVEDLKKRLEIINDSEADFFASIHLNAIPSSRWKGAQTFYSGHLKESKRGAKFIQEELRRNLENTNREAKTSNDIYILKNSEIPGVLVEIGFLSNPTERELLRQDAYQEQVAASIYQGIIRYYTNERKILE
ncbi:N-acetylmuramoyl-L-alanine amidase CwlD [Mesobacillus maritimus]|uniref:N-acetylmuramoyl-L-alanine amidase CwlD n=1 Tax=Mesobacillus maritimus TaxID=1643336 RepID=UPI002041EB75|nr:N-acetylmuramoyl-L-alanine amidase CwlD [Mesobacillus maritimus]MCM3588535.1 N-acetylmuramoyl-L-alanine amidase CwlD [Mesobacillus maritimus]MCM3671499.1 N-acetylmuramoyl-L-alanine amidase CwlD [Mesobacillus maritimus]